MAVQYKTIFMGLQKPSELSRLVSIPMHMYRIQTSEFTSGLNFFQKAVLKLKFMPQISNSKIAQLLGLDESIVNLIVYQLERMDLLTSSGYLTEEGLKIRDNANGFIVNDNKTKMGYVFAYDNGSVIFPYYQKHIEYASITENELVYNTERGERSIPKPYNISSEDHNDGECPNEEQILKLISNSSQKERDDEYSTNSEVENLNETYLNIRFVPDNTPEIINVCTYVYLPQNEDGEYEDDWQVLDPFTRGNSYELKLYLEKMTHEEAAFGSELLDVFGKAETEGRKKYAEAQRWIKDRTEERINMLFGKDFSILPESISGFVSSVIEYKLRLEENGFSSVDQKQNLFINMQSTLERILVIDNKEREYAYTDIINNYGQDNSDTYSKEEWHRFSKFEKNEIKRHQAEAKALAKQERIRMLKTVFYKKWLSDTQEVPQVLLLKADRLNGKSLLDYLMRFILSLTVEYDLEKCTLLKVFKGHINDIVELADIRNSFGHGGQDKKDVKVEKINALYELFIQIISDYIKYKYYE